MKYKKYVKIRKKIMAAAAGGVMASVLFLGSGTVYADTMDGASPVRSEKTAPMHVMRHFNSQAKAGNLARKFGLDRQRVRRELRFGKSMKQILQENGIDTTNLPQALG